MASEHSEAFEYDTVGERAISLAHQLAARRARSTEEIAALGPQAGAVVLAELTDTIAQGLAAVALSMLANGRAVARAADAAHGVLNP
jgi:hypothetical protein